MAARDRLLGGRRAYGVFRRSISADRAMAQEDSDHVRSPASDRRVHVGRVTGDLARFLPRGVEYLGIDHNAAYRGGDGSVVGRRRSFVVADLDDVAGLELNGFDLALAIRVAARPAAVSVQPLRDRGSEVRRSRMRRTVDRKVAI